ncbi:hypothetical protein ASPTUDRAFT_922348 [Aspergillus tubingensis CBS 134.48]|uniref:Uncharacterized protein n=1 Tax=Aspergillus tubingensis (strain CBS 134.48) TaxID=767770 RepID=A0A1L9NE41_ASPTC|nr:hypothetical protein ASPTUDRAFT_922348 [Aspergillus tubingensis CBS 134.48]
MTLSPHAELRSCRIRSQTLTLIHLLRHEAVITYHLLKTNLGAGVLLYLSAACIRLLPPPDSSVFTVFTKIFCVSVSHQYCWDIVK